MLRGCRGTSTSAAAPAAAAAAATPAAAAAPADEPLDPPPDQLDPPSPPPAFIRCTASSPAIAGSDAHTADIPKRPIPSAAPTGPYSAQSGVPSARAWFSSRSAASVRSPRCVRRGAEASRTTATIVTAMSATTSHPTGRAFAIPASSRSRPSPATASIHQPVPRIRRRCGLGEQQARVDQPPLGRRERVGHPVVVRDPLAVDRVATAAWTARSSSSCPASERGDGLRVAALRPDRAAQPERGERRDPPARRRR